MGFQGVNFGLVSSIFSSVVSKFEMRYEFNQPKLLLGPDETPKPWSPPQYSRAAVTSITVPAVWDTATGIIQQPPIVYVFDAVLKIDHRNLLVKTQHPVLTGASISDHAYMQPHQVTLEIGMSDVMAAYSANMWVGAATKSVSAWQTLKQLQLNRTLLGLLTRLDQYTNMIIESVTTSDTNSTYRGLRATVVFSEVISAGVTAQPIVSTRPQTTDSTSSGIVQGVDPNPVIEQQHKVPTNDDLKKYINANPLAPPAGSDISRFYGTLTPGALSNLNYNGSGNFSSTVLGDNPFGLGGASGGAGAGGPNVLP